MPISLFQADYWNLFQDEQISQDFDNTWRYPQELGEGYYRCIQLQQGMELAIAHYQLYDDFVLQLPEREHPLEFSFYLSGSQLAQQHAIHSGQNALYGSGMAPQETCGYSAKQAILDVSVHMEPKLFRSFIGDPNGQIPAALNSLMRASDQEYYIRSGITTMAMQLVLQQILHCPHQGLTKRLYLESKVWELMALQVEQELEIREAKCDRCPLKSDDLDRIHQAKEILVQHLDNPPSLLNLARQVGLNDCTLKRGFRQVFGTTAFGYLHHQRLEKAQQLLTAQEMNITEVARTVGFASRSYFAAAFRKKFGVNPKIYLTQQKNSV